MPFSQGSNASPLIEAFIPWVHAEEITWNPPSSLGVPSFPEPAEQYWVYPWEDWKNDILIRLQQALIDRGVAKEDTKYFVMQAIQENGRMDPLYCKGDSGQSYGIGQWYELGSNACARLQRDGAKNPDGTINRDAELTRQLNMLADSMAEYYKKYPGDPIAAVAAHNGPGRIERGERNSDGQLDSCRYVSRKNSQGVRYKVWSCYWKDEVSNHASKLTLKP